LVVYQVMVSACHARASTKCKRQQRIESLTTGVPAIRVELRTLRRTLKQRAADILAYFDRPGTSNGGTKRFTAASSASAGHRSGSANLPN
jgi:transposase